MKKKLLSLVLAGAMVASTSVSAFAATEDATYNIDSTTSQNHKVTITGDIADEHNATLPGTITVTVPTTMSFTVDKDGKVSGGNITVTNKSKDSVEVVAKEFNDSTPGSKIVLVKDTDLDGKIDSADGNKYVSLKLIGENKTVELVSTKTGKETGFVNENGDAILDTEKTSLGNAVDGSNLVLSLEGRAKHSTKDYSTPTTAINDTFNLILKIQKTTK